MPAPYFLFFDLDADRGLKIPVSAATRYMSLDEGRPAQLRKCKVMVEVAGQAKWFLIITRYDANGRKNHAVQETTGFHWLGPLVIMKLEKKGSRRPLGMISSRDLHIAISALERYLEEMTRELSHTGATEWRPCIDEPEDDACFVPARVAESIPGEPQI